MAHASPGTDTSTDPDAEEKNQMVITIFKFNIYAITLIFYDAYCKISSY